MPNTHDTAPAAMPNTRETPATTKLDERLESKIEQLVALLRSYGRVAIACSGGVDSSFLTAVCDRHLPDDAMLAHVESAMVPASEARSYADLLGRVSLPHVELAEDPFADADVVANGPRRCYFCKFTEFGGIIEAARECGYDVVVDGSNADDESDYRPGLRATAELGVRSPLREAGWHKDDERAVLRAWGWPAADLPSSACLASRIPYGEEITRAKVECVARSEDYLHELGFRVVRVRLSNWRAGIEVGREERGKLLDADLLDQIDAALRSFGCKDVLVRARGYSMGSLNAALDEKTLEKGRQRG